MSDIDQQIAEFHAAGRRRKAWIFGISGILMLVLGAVILYFTFTMIGEEDTDTGTHRFPIKILVGGVAFAVGGLSSLYNAYRLASGQINDVDTGDPR